MAARFAVAVGAVFCFCFTPRRLRQEISEVAGFPYYLPLDMDFAGTETLVSSWRMRYFWSVAGIFLSVVALYYFAEFLPDHLLSQVGSRRQVFFVGAAVMAPAYLIRGYKSWLVLNEPAKIAGTVAGSLYASIALNNVLPFRLGDIVRLFYLKTVLRIGLAKATAALIIERVIDLIIILVLFVLSAGFILPGRTVRLPLGGNSWRAAGVFIGRFGPRRWLLLWLS